MKELLALLMQQKDVPAVTIMLPTHRTHPDNLQDEIQLKNLIKTAEEQLYEKYEKRTVWPILEHLQAIESDINRDYNLDALIIYATPTFAKLVKLATEVTARVVIGDSFDVRPVYKAMQQVEHYYIISISMQKIRLLEAFNNKLVQEFSNKDFPFENTQYYTSDPIRKGQGNVEDKYLMEYFNVADKRFKTYYYNNPLPVVLAGDSWNLSHYPYQMDIKDIVMGTLEGSYDHTDPGELVRMVYPVVSQVIKDRQSAYLHQIEAGQRAQRVMDDLNDIYRAATGGNAESLYLERDFFQPGRIKDGLISVSQEKDAPDVVLDLVDAVAKSGGNVVFMDPGTLSIYNGVALVTRY